MVQDKITEYEVIDHGIDHAQYFQGCGVAFSEFDHCVTGCGDNFDEAKADAIEQIYGMDFNADSIDTSETKCDPRASAMIRDQIADDMRKEVIDPSNGEVGYVEASDDEIDEAMSECDSELTYYVSIRWK